MGIMGACLLNKRRERRQNGMRMRVKRLQEIMEGKYACLLSRVMKHSDQRGCMNIIRTYERIIRELLGFYDVRDMSNEINLLLFLSANLSSGTCATFIHVRTSND